MRCVVTLAALALVAGCASGPLAFLQFRQAGSQNLLMQVGGFRSADCPAFGSGMKTSQGTLVCSTESLSRFLPVRATVRSKEGLLLDIEAQDLAVCNKVLEGMGGLNVDLVSGCQPK